MKTLILIRHAKSSWDGAGLSDAERPLNERGKKDAPEMAQRLREKELPINVFVSSPARRARKTARYFAEAFDVSKEDIQIVEALYLATREAFSETIASLSDDHSSAAIFSHNPGITEFASSLSNVKLDNMPTCGVFAVQSDAGTWKDFDHSEKKFLFFDYPKNPLP